MKIQKRVGIEGKNVEIIRGLINRIGDQYEENSNHRIDNDFRYSRDTNKYKR